FCLKVVPPHGTCFLLQFVANLIFPFNCCSQQQFWDANRIKLLQLVAEGVWGKMWGKFRSS
ncbi:MAG: hypothetical protein VX228_05690, partial [Pseudomonadota bacterium]|nr:hypothetical protein [Pseudomonadota bacterium]